MTLHRILRDEPGGDVKSALRARRLVQTWTAAAPQVRAAVLLDAAWNSRQHEFPRRPSSAQVHAYHLNLHARAHAGGRQSFRGPSFPAMPLPGPAGTLASSLGFDRDQCEVSLETVLLLLREGQAKTGG